MKNYVVEQGIEHSKAHYGMRFDGTISVTNIGAKDGKTKIAYDKAKRTDEKISPLGSAAYCHRDARTGLRSSIPEQDRLPVCYRTNVHCFHPSKVWMRSVSVSASTKSRGREA